MRDLVRYGKNEGPLDREFAAHSGYPLNRSGQYIRYCRTAKAWYIWDGTRKRYNVEVLEENV